MIIELQEFAVIIKIFSFEKLEKNQIKRKETEIWPSSISSVCEAKVGVPVLSVCRFYAHEQQ